MITFFGSIALLLLGYFVYGKFVERYFGASVNRITPAKRLADGVDYKELKPIRIFVIQFLNIAGLGPIFGAILGAAYGPMAYVWIVVGNIFMGAVHDYFSGMLSLRNGGTSTPNIIGRYLGRGTKIYMLIIVVFLLFAVAASFITGPSDLLNMLTGIEKHIWLFIIFAYYIVACLLPIDKIIGKIYPFLGAFLLLMTAVIAGSLIFRDFNGSVNIPELVPSTFANWHFDPDQNVLLPMLFVVISCGAISGFHSTQSPLMARCLGNEKYGRPIFYGAMICEGIVAIIWATAAIAYCGGFEGLNEAAAVGKTPAILVNEICNSWLGKTGAFLAIIGVVVCPLTSGDTALRSLRLVFADWLKINQDKMSKRLLISIPIFVLSFFLCLFDFSTIWKYVGITNQLMASVILWTVSAYFQQKRKSHLLTSIPATIMTFVCCCYLLVAPYKNGGLALDPRFGYIVSTVVAALSMLSFCLRKYYYNPPRIKPRERNEVDDI